jgi:hypothetical protein
MGSMRTVVTALGAVTLLSISCSPESDGGGAASNGSIGGDTGAGGSAVGASGGSYGAGGYGGAATGTGGHVNASGGYGGGAQYGTGGVRGGADAGPHTSDASFGAGGASPATCPVLIAFEMKSATYYLGGTFSGNRVSGTLLPPASSVSMTFTLFSMQTGGTSTWGTSQLLNAENGCFANAPWVPPPPVGNWYLEIRVGSELLAPRAYVSVK